MLILSLKQKDTPALVIFYIQKNTKKFVFNQEITTKNVANFLMKFIKNKLKPHEFGEEIEEDDSRYRD